MAIIHQQNGFTLLELMVVLAIVAILAAVGLPFMRDTILNQRVRTAGTDAHLGLLLARSEAIKRNANVNIENAGGSWAAGWNVCVPEPGVPACDSDPDISPILSTRQTIEDVTVACSTDTDPGTETCPDRLAFNHLGRPDTLLEYRFYVDENTRVFTRCVKLSISGVPRVVIDNDFDHDNGCE